MVKIRQKEINGGVLSKPSKDGVGFQIICGVLWNVFCMYSFDDPVAKLKGSCFFLKSWAIFCSVENFN